MAVIVQEDVKPDRVRYSDRRKRAAAAKRMRSGKQGGWQSLSREDREFIAAVFQEYDVDGTGTMGAEQIRPLLQRLAGGKPPTEEEVKAVLDQADNDKSGAVSIDELKDVIRIWYTMCQAKPQKGVFAASCRVM